MGSTRLEFGDLGRDGSSLSRSPELPPLMITFVLPAWNEEDMLPPLLEAIRREMDEARMDYRVLVVDDGSEDGTAAAVERAANFMPITCLRHPRNLGLGEALRTGLSAEDGTEVLLRALTTQLPQVLVSTRNLPWRIEEAALEVDRWRRDDGSTPESTAPSLTGARHPRPELGTAFVDPGTDTERELAAVWAELMGIDRVGARDDFFELGGNSLLLMQVSVRLREAFGVRLSMRELFDTRTLSSLAERVDALRLLGGMGRDASAPGDDTSDETEELRL